MLAKLLEKKMKEVEPEKMGDEPMASHEYYPSVNFNLKQLPESKNWKVGKDYYLAIKVTMTSYSESEEHSNANFEVKEVGVINKDVEKEDLKKLYE